MKYKVVNSMSEEVIRKLSFNEYVEMFSKGKMIYSTTRLKQSYTAKVFQNLLLINEVLSLCVTYEEDYCKERPEWYCSRINLDDILTVIETKTKKKTEYVKKFTKEDICNVINNYIFLLK